MKRPYYQEAGVTIYCADARELAGSIAADSVITDPVWPNASTNLAGSDDPQALVSEVFHQLKCKRLIIQLGFDSDPRFLQAVPARLPFVWACWLDYARPHYKGFLLAGADLAYVFGALPERDGWMVLPGMCRSTASDGKVAGHPCARKLEHVRWLCRFYGQGTVLDPFLGSGTTAVACKALGIHFVGIEIEERFCELAVNRLAQASLDLQLAVDRSPLVPETHDFTVEPDTGERLRAV